MSAYDCLRSEWLDPRASFETFAVDDGNRLAHAAALAVAELPGRAYIPLFLTGPSRSGKTYLLHAVGNYVVREERGLPVQFANASDLAQLASPAWAALANVVATLDVVLIDDVHFDEKGVDVRFAVVVAAMVACDTPVVLAHRRSPGDVVLPRFDESPRGLVAELRGRHEPYAGGEGVVAGAQGARRNDRCYEVAAAKPTSGSRSSRRPASVA